MTARLDSLIPVARERLTRAGSEARRLLRAAEPLRVDSFIASRDAAVSALAEVGSALSARITTYGDPTEEASQLLSWLASNTTLVSAGLASPDLLFGMADRLAAFLDANREELPSEELPRRTA